MKQLYNIGFYLLILVTIASCTKDNPASFSMEKPNSIAVQDSIDSGYSPLKTYVDTLDSNFKLGVGLSATAFSDQGAMYSLVNSNFQEVTAHDLGHNSVVQADGSIVMESMNNFLSAARDAGISVYGNALISPENDNVAYLSELIAPTLQESSGPTWDIVTSADFETDDASNYQSNEGAVTSFTADGEGANGEGRAIQVENEVVRENDWQSQFFVTFSPATVAGEQYRISMDIRADQEATFPTQAHGQPGGYLHWDFFGSITATTEWTTYTTQITISENTDEAATIAFNLGSTATNFYYDNIVLEKFNEDGGNVYVEKTPEEKEVIITTELENWVSTIVDTASYINTWEVVSEPIADTSPLTGQDGNNFNLKSTGELDWHTYLGADYGVKAFQSARASGDSNDLLFISDYGLEANLSKCDALINYVNYIESNGATVDGISTKMQISINTSEQNISDMLQKLADTGKMVNIAELNVGLGGISAEVASTEIHEAQAAMYQHVVDEYFSIVPENQRYGITVINPVDNTGNPAGLWTSNYTRKMAYAGFSVGLMNGFNSGN
jgi:hypothetical protein